MTDSPATALHHVVVDDAKVAYVEAGEGEPVLLVHGYPQSHEAWRFQIEELSKTHRVIAVDWPGWGASERKGDMDMSYDAEVARLDRLLDALKIERCNLVVHDYGGYIGLGFVLAKSERVLRFAIINSRAHETFPRTAFWARWMLVAGGRYAPWLFSRLPLHTIHELGLEPFESAGCFDDAQVHRYLDWMREPAGRRWLVRDAAQYSLRPRRESLVPLADLRVPTAIIWGSADPWCPESIATELAATIPDAKLEIVEHGLHFLMEHRPRDVTRALRALLERPPAELGKLPPAPKPVPPLPWRESPIFRAAVLAGWCWLVCAVSVVFGMAGLFTEQVGPLQTNQAHALGLNLSLGLFGFAFARFQLERYFVLASGLGMLAVSLLGFYNTTQEWMYETFNLNATSSWIELCAGVVSLALWLAFRPKPSQR
jgi:pimeloyl-ACP methyl ester carboxylesterase